MKMEEILPAFRAGAKIRRGSWRPGHYMFLKRDRMSGEWFDWLVLHDPDPGLNHADWHRSYDSDITITPRWLLADDWEIAP